MLPCLASIWERLRVKKSALLRYVIGVARKGCSLLSQIPPTTSPAETQMPQMERLFLSIDSSAFATPRLQRSSWRLLSLCRPLSISLWQRAAFPSDLLRDSVPSAIFLFPATIWSLAKRNRRSLCRALPKLRGLNGTRKLNRKPFVRPKDGLKGFRWLRSRFLTMREAATISGLGGRTSMWIRISERTSSACSTKIA